MSNGGHTPQIAEAGDFATKGEPEFALRFAGALLRLTFRNGASPERVVVRRNPRGAA